MPVNMDKYAAKKAAIDATFGDVPWYTWKEGQNIIRILPPPPGWDEFEVELQKAWVGPNNRSIIPPSQYGQPCAYQDWMAKLQRAADPVSLKTMEEAKIKFRHIAMVIDRTQGDNIGPQPLDFNKPTMGKILSIMASPEYGDITDPVNGVDLQVEYTKKSKSGFPEWSVVASRKSTPLTVDPTKMQVWTQTNYFDQWHIREATDNGYIAACIEGKEENYKRDAAATSAATPAADPATSFNPAEFSQTPGSVLPAAQQPVAPVVAAAPVDRMFWVTINGQTAGCSETDLRTLVASGQQPSVIGQWEPQGTQWLTAAHYGIFPPAPPAPVAAPSPVAAPAPVAPPVAVAPAPQVPVVAPVNMPVAAPLVAPPVMAPPIQTASPVAAPVAPVAPVAPPVAVPVQPPFVPTAPPVAAMPAAAPVAATEQQLAAQLAGTGPAGFPRPAVPATPVPSPAASGPGNDVRAMLT